MIDLIVFDLDGTLVDSHKDLACAANALVRRAGRHGRVRRRQSSQMVGEGAAVLVRRALAASGLEPDTPGALDRFLAIYDTCLLDRTRPYPGMVETLERLATPIARLAVLTNKPARATADGSSTASDLSRFFHQVVGGDSAVRPKARSCRPAPHHRACGRVGSVDDAGRGLALSIAKPRAAPALRICLARFGFGYTFKAGDLEGDEVIVDSAGEIASVLGF